MLAHIIHNGQVSWQTAQIAEKDFLVGLGPNGIKLNLPLQLAAAAAEN